jgi:hypothetical protein
MFKKYYSIIIIVFCMIIFSNSDLFSQNSEYESKHFLISYSEKIGYEEIQIIGLIADDIYDKVGMVLRYYPISKIKIQCFSSAEIFAERTGYPEFVGGVFDHQSNTILLQEPNMLRKHGVIVQILAHEYTHLILSTITNNNVPYWLAEGLSIIFSAQLYFPETNVKIANLKDLEEQLRNPNLSKNTREDLYNKSRLIIIFLLKYYSLSDIRTMLSYLSQGFSFKESLERSINLPYDVFEKHVITMINKVG